MGGDVYVAFSPTGTKGSWEVVNSENPVGPEAGIFYDTRLVMNGGSAAGYYKLLLSSQGEDVFSEPFSITGDLTASEYGIVRGIIHREFTDMRVTNGFPVWHCIPRVSGKSASNVDPDTGRTTGPNCGADAGSLVFDEDGVPVRDENGELLTTEPDPDASYGLPYAGGFYPPVLTWMRVLSTNRGELKDSPDETAPIETDIIKARLMAFPRPARGHMFVDPSTDRRYIVGDDVDPFDFRGVLPVAYEANLSFLKQSDPRYKFMVPTKDMKAYRKMKYWTLEQ
jgi:hypothetical protein